MLKALTVFAAALLISSAAGAQCISTYAKPCPDNGSATGPGRSSGYDVRPSNPDDRGDRVSPYSPNQPERRYEQQPTFGDPDRTRRTDPRRCTGLLCD